MSSGKPIFEKSYIIAEVPEALSDDIISWCYDNIDDESLYFDPFDNSFGRETYIHLTVLACVEDAEKNILSTIESLKKTACCLGNIKLFTQNTKFDVVMIEILDQNVLKLHSTLSKNIINNPDFPKYIPHVTIAYVKKGHGEKFLENKYFSGEVFDIAELVYSHKSGSKTKFQLGQK